MHRSWAVPRCAQRAQHLVGRGVDHVYLPAAYASIFRPAARVEIRSMNRELTGRSKSATETAGPAGPLPAVRLGVLRKAGRQRLEDRRRQRPIGAANASQRYLKF